MTIQTRNVVDRVEDEFEHGHRETRTGDDDPWTVVPRSCYARNLRRFWFQRDPVDIMAIDMGFETTAARANEFAGASDNDPDLWFHLAAASPAGTGDEALKWIMGALAAEVKTRGLRFRDIPSVMPAPHLAMFVRALSDGRIDRSMAKSVFAALLAMPRSLDAETRSADFAALIARPEFVVASDDELTTLVEGIMEANPDQVAKAKDNPKLVQWFVGQAMKATGGKARADKVIGIVNEKLA